MPPKPKITKQQILEKALAIVREKGLAALTAKALAGTLGCSTQPVFWHYDSMEAVRADVFSGALKVFGKALRRESDCGSRYMALGLNYIRFASEERELFRMLFMSDAGKTDLIGAQVEREYVMSIIEETEHITGESAQTVYKDMWLFSHGIAAMIAAGAANFSEEELREMLGDVCRGLIAILKNKTI